MTAQTNVLAFRPRQPTASPALVPRDAHDADLYDFAAVILEEGYRLAMHHIKVTVPALNAAACPQR